MSSSSPGRFAPLSVTGRVLRYCLYELQALLFVGTPPLWIVCAGTQPHSLRGFTLESIESRSMAQPNDPPRANPLYLIAEPWGRVAVTAGTSVVSLFCTWNFWPEWALFLLVINTLVVLVVLPWWAPHANWPSYNWSTAVFNTAALLVISSLIFQTSREAQQPAFAEQVSRTPPGQPFVLRLRAPKALRQYTETSQGQSLQVVIDGLTPTMTTPTVGARPTPGPQATAITNPPPTIQPVTYTLTFGHDDGVEFVNPDRTAVPSQLTFTWPTDARRTALLRLAAGVAPAVFTTTLTVQLEPTGGTAIPLDALPITIESDYAAWIRFFAARLLGDLSFLVGLALAISGWGLEVGKQQQERAQKERDEAEAAKLDHRRAHLRAIGTMLTDNFPRAVLEYKQFKTEQAQLNQQDPQWQEPLKHEADQLDALIEGRKTRDLKARLIREAGATFGDGNFPRGVEYLDVLDYLFFSTDSDSTLKSARSLIKPSSDTDLLSLLLAQDRSEKLLATAFALWNNHNEDARDLCVFLVKLMFDSTPAVAPAMIESKVRNADGSLDLPPGWRFLRDPRLVEHRDFPDAVRNALSNYAYAQSWGMPLVSVQNGEAMSPNDEAIARALAQQHEHFFPLDFIWSRLDPHCLTTEELAEQIIVLPSVYADDSSKQSSYLLLGETRPIRLAVIHKLCNEHKKVFPVALTLPTPLVPHLEAPHAHVQAISAGVGAAWLQFLRSSAGASAFLDLPLAAQHLVGRLLVTVTGSLAACEVHLGITGQHESSLDKRMLLRRLREVAPDGRLTDPNELISALAIRPPGLQQTRVLIDLFAGGGEQPRQIDQLLALAPVLHRHNITLQIFSATLEGVTLPVGMQKRTLTWNEDQQQAMLNKLIWFASGETIEEYSAIFPNSVMQRLSTPEQLITAAAGSFVKLAALARADLGRIARGTVA